tara:strand:+ start:761 stop:925 length:165 start_codon:yes stop_codon:yes gene_type:complete
MYWWGYCIRFYIHWEINISKADFFGDSNDEIIKDFKKLPYIQQRLLNLPRCLEA